MSVVVLVTAVVFIVIVVVFMVMLVRVVMAACAAVPLAHMAVCGHCLIVFAVHSFLPLPFFHYMVKCHGKNFSYVGVIQRIVDDSPLLAALYDPGHL